MNEIQTGAATLNFISFEYVFEVGSDTALDISCYLYEVLALNDSTKLLAQVLIGTLDYSVLHLDKLIRFKRHPLECTVLLNLVLDREEKFLGETL